MLDWLHQADVAVFRWINLSLANGLGDWLMPRVSDPPYGVAVAVALLAWLAWKGGARGRLCVAAILLSLVLGNWLVVDTLKHALARPRPFHEILEAHVLTGRADSFSMPSSHAANWFSAALVGFVYYRRSIYWLLPMATLVAFSRVANGVHYPSDVLAGAVIGAGYAAAVIWLMEALWQWLGPRWFTNWWRRLPSLLQPNVRRDIAPADEGQWLRLGYALVALMFGLRLAFLAVGRLELSEDEAYQWIWSKHLALSYYSKPPLIACTQFLGTHLWGDSEFGVRFFSPVITALISLLLLRFMNRLAGGRAALALLLICSTTPLLALGSVLMTIDPLSVLFWTAAMIMGWRAAQPEGRTRDWLWVGLWIGLGFLSKYTNLFQLVCWVVFFALWAPARAHLRRRGPWLALLVIAICLTPVLVWNAQRGWITVKHVASDGHIGQAWTRPFVGDFLLAEGGLLHPVYFVGAIWAAVAFWRQGRRDPLQLFLFSMGMPLFLLYFFWSWHSRVFPNWIAPAVTPMFCLMVVYWRARWTAHARILRPILATGMGVGALAVVLFHDPHLLEKLISRPLPAKFDPLGRVHGWKELAGIVGAARTKLAAEGPPVFLIGEHYGITSQVTFYLPEAKERVQTDPLVFFYATATPQNQFFYWPNYLDRHGQNAIFFRRLGLPSESELKNPHSDPPPPEITRQFESVQNLGIRNVVHDGKVVRRVELFACHHLH
ncbi:MAG TPA: glycosyltransferase family 39 protein [Verrucomicrobiae bacterium]|jgi:4-amino-4-deoxy-L-arabinose transferase-like glycosyltransferase/membrane-associated phospholipid phosphatase|nr:glycosyltransferase family 39 protein [Verrucomicrobiae bacterium]